MNELLNYVYVSLHIYPYAGSRVLLVARERWVDALCLCYLIQTLETFWLRGKIHTSVEAFCSFIHCSIPGEVKPILSCTLKSHIACQQKLEGHLRINSGNRRAFYNSFHQSLDIDDESKDCFECFFCLDIKRTLTLDTLKEAF